MKTAGTLEPVQPLRAGGLIRDHLLKLARMIRADLNSLTDSTRASNHKVPSSLIYNIQSEF